MGLKGQRLHISSVSIPIVCCNICQTNCYVRCSGLDCRSLGIRSYASAMKADPNLAQVWTTWYAAPYAIVLPTDVIPSHDVWPSLLHESSLDGLVSESKERCQNTRLTHGRRCRRYEMSRAAAHLENYGEAMRYAKSGLDAATKQQDEDGIAAMTSEDARLAAVGTKKEEL